MEFDSRRAFFFSYAGSSVLVKADHELIRGCCQINFDMKLWSVEIYLCIRKTCLNILKPHLKSSGWRLCIMYARH